MNILRKISVVLGIMVVGSYLAHNYLLSEEQRAEVAETKEELRVAFEEVSDAISPLVSKGAPTKAEERAAAEVNRERTAEQWEALGY